MEWAFCLIHFRIRNPLNLEVIWPSPPKMMHLIWMGLNSCSSVFHSYEPAILWSIIHIPRPPQSIIHIPPPPPPALWVCSHNLCSEIPVEGFFHPKTSGVWAGFVRQSADNKLPFSCAFSQKLGSSTEERTAHEFCEEWSEGSNFYKAYPVFGVFQKWIFLNINPSSILVSYFRRQSQALKGG